MATVKFTTFAKRRNSTKQPTSVTWDTRSTTYLKESTSQDAPIFKVTGNNFNYNYCEWDGKYYFIHDIESLINNEIAVHCVLDPLATYKSYITASTQFVSYSASETLQAYLTDTRIPVLKNAKASKSVASMSSLFGNGFYVLTVVGKDGCNTVAADFPTIKALLDKINDWSDDLIDDVLNGSYPWTSTSSVTYDFTTVEAATESLAKMNALTGFAGNAYSAAPSCIRSCIWVPFAPTEFLDTGINLYLGQFDTGLRPFRIKGDPVTGSTSVSIPWHHTGWRRSVCEEVYLYLPLVGMVSLSSDNLAQSPSLTIKYSATATDGCVCYQVVAGNQIIGSYGGQCSANYPIGISQQASAGQIAQTAFGEAEKMMNTGLQAATSLNPAGWAVGAANLRMEAVAASYNITDTALSRNNSCIGGVGGGAGAGLDLNVTCYTVAHDTTVPADVPSTDPDYSTIHPQYLAYVNTMGLPVMKSMSLSGLTGFTQCANAHVEAPATAGELNAIDAMLNNGFYIE